MFREVNVTDEDIDGRLFLHSMPGRYERWNEFVAEAERAHLDTIVCLTPTPEIEEKSPDYLDAINKGELPCPRLAYPIRDFHAPDDREEFMAFLESLAQELVGGQRLLLHCAGGIGRTGTTAICLLQQAGLDPERAEDLVNEAKAGPECSEQKDLIRWHARSANPGIS